MSDQITVEELAEALHDEQPYLERAPRIAHVLHHSIDWDARRIYLDDHIEEETGSWFWTALRQLGSDPVDVFLNTPGGDVTSMYAIHDAIRSHGGVTVCGYGQVCSAGVLVLACAKDRIVAESTVLMSHEATADSGELGYRAAKDRRKLEDWQHVYWCELMARYTPHDAKWWKQKTERQAEYWLLGGEAIVAAGIADRVL